MICAPSEDWSAWASAHSDPSSLFTSRKLGSLAIIGAHSEDVRLGRCPGWSESSLGTHIIWLVLSCCGSFKSESYISESQRSITLPLKLLPKRCSILRTIIRCHCQMDTLPQQDNTTCWKLYKSKNRIFCQTIRLTSFNGLSFSAKPVLMD